MMFLGDMAFAAELIALGVGVFLLFRVSNDKEACCRGFATVAAYFIIIASVLTMTCTVINAYKTYKQKPGMMMRMGPGKHPGGMGPGGRMEPADPSGPGGNRMEQPPVKKW